MPEWTMQVNAHWGDVKLEDVLDPEPRRTAFEFERRFAIKKPEWFLSFL